MDYNDILDIFGLFFGRKNIHFGISRNRACLSSNTVLSLIESIVITHLCLIQVRRYKNIWEFGYGSFDFGVSIWGFGFYGFAFGGLFILWVFI